MPHTALLSSLCIHSAVIVMPAMTQPPPLQKLSRKLIATVNNDQSQRACVRSLFVSVCLSLSLSLSLLNGDRSNEFLSLSASLSLCLCMSVCLSVCMYVALSFSLSGAFNGDIMTCSSLSLSFCVSLSHSLSFGFLTRGMKIFLSLCLSLYLNGFQVVKGRSVGLHFSFSTAHVLHSV